jgi:N-acetylmuramoyl-L-alanine amidase
MYEQFFTEGMPSLLETNKITYQKINNCRSDDMNIIGKPSATYMQCEQWLRNKKYYDPVALENLPLLWHAAISNGIDPVILISQAMIETGFFKFGGVIDSSYHNTCGLKCTKGGGDYVANAHMRFKTWEDGIQAHADHLGLYAGSPNCPKYSPECASHQNKDYKVNGVTKDPRHFTYLHGKYKTVKSLTGSWATDPQYDKKLMTFIKEIQNTKTTEDPHELADKPVMKTSNKSIANSNKKTGPLNKNTIINNINKGIKNGSINPFKRK